MKKYQFTKTKQNKAKQEKNSYNQENSNNH